MAHGDTPLIQPERKLKVGDIYGPLIELAIHGQDNKAKSLFKLPILSIHTFARVGDSLANLVAGKALDSTNTQWFRNI